MTTRTHLYSIQASLSIDAVSRMMGLWLMRHIDDCGRDVIVFCVLFVCVCAFVFEYLCLCVVFQGFQPQSNPLHHFGRHPLAWFVCARCV